MVRMKKTVLSFLCLLLCLFVGTAALCDDNVALPSLPPDPDDLITNPPITPTPTAKPVSKTDSPDQKTAEPTNASAGGSTPPQDRRADGGADHARAVGFAGFLRVARADAARSDGYAAAADGSAGRRLCASKHGRTGNRRADRRAKAAAGPFPRGVDCDRRFCRGAADRRRAAAFTKAPLIPCLILKGVALL